MLNGQRNIECNQYRVSFWIIFCDLFEDPFNFFTLVQQFCRAPIILYEWFIFKYTHCMQWKNGAAFTIAHNSNLSNVIYLILNEINREREKNNIYLLYLTLLSLCFRFSIEFISHIKIMNNQIIWRTADDVAFVVTLTTMIYDQIYIIRSNYLISEPFKRPYNSDSFYWFYQTTFIFIFVVVCNNTVYLLLSGSLYRIDSV